MAGCARQRLPPLSPASSRSQRGGLTPPRPPPCSQWALELQGRQDELFWDEVGGGYFQAAAGDASLRLRMKEDYDGAEPAASSVAATNLWRLAGLAGTQAGRELRRRAEKAVSAFGERLEEVPLAMPQMCCCLHLLELGHPRQVGSRAQGVGRARLQLAPAPGCRRAWARALQGGLRALPHSLARPPVSHPPTYPPTHPPTHPRVQVIIAGRAGAPDTQAQLYAAHAQWTPDKVVILLDLGDEAVMEFWRAHNPEAVAVAEVKACWGGAQSCSPMRALVNARLMTALSPRHQRTTTAPPQATGMAADDAATAFVCQNFTCRRPTTSPAATAQLLAEPRGNAAARPKLSTAARLPGDA